MNIKILDCTLRDGGYINNWEFNNSNISEVVKQLSLSKIDIIECGFLDDTNGKVNNSTRFFNIENLNNLINKNIVKSALPVAMIEYGKYSVKTLPSCEDSLIKGIRYSFRKSDFLNSIKDMKIIKDKGYKLFIQPISTNSYNEIELNELILESNRLDAYALYIVDTQGSMFKDDFRRLYYCINKSLKNDIYIGFHSHNNMQLSYSIAIDFIENAHYRNIIIDSSIYGMGRGAGNLNTELLADYINKKIENKYNIDNILSLIDNYFYSIYKEKNWGYSLAHFLSASLECHPNYASYLLNKKQLNINAIKTILAEIPLSDSFEFDKNLIEKLYFNYSSKMNFDLKELIFNTEKKILLVGSGKNIESKVDYINQNRNKYIIIALNHIPLKLFADYIFFNSEKRYLEFYEKADDYEIIITSNLKVISKYILDFQKLSIIENSFHDNSAVMFVNYLVSKGVRNVELAGVDGFDTDKENYNYTEYDKVVDADAINDLNKHILEGFKLLSQKIDIKFLTNSIFKSKLKQKIIGVIPSRYASTRLPGKQLSDICGLPMVIHVLKRAMLSDILDEVIVATDDEKILKEVEKYGGRAIMTSLEHNDGNARMHEVSKIVNGDIFVLINGDEPLVEPRNIKESVEGLINSKRADASVLVTPYNERNNTTNLKMVLNRNDEVMYISRSDIPSDAREEQKPMWKGFYIVSYWKEFLDKFVLEFEETELNSRETTDQNKILEYGYTLQAVKTNSKAISVDTQDDLEKVRKMMETDELFLTYKEIR